MSREEAPGSAPRTDEQESRPSRALRRGAAVLVGLLIGGVSLIAWEGEPDETAVDGLDPGATWAIWTVAALLAALAATVLFRRERELRIGILYGVVLGLLAAVAVLWVGVAAAG